MDLKQPNLVLPIAFGCLLLCLLSQVTGTVIFNALKKKLKYSWRALLFHHPTRCSAKQ